MSYQQKMGDRLLMIYGTLAFVMGSATIVTAFADKGTPLHEKQGIIRLCLPGWITFTCFAVMVLIWETHF